MHPEIVAAVCAQIYRQFPQVTGATPKIRRQPHPTEATPTAETVYLLTFGHEARGEGGVCIPQWVRAAVSAQGKIIKISISK